MKIKSLGLLLVLSVMVSSTMVSASDLKDGYTVDKGADVLGDSGLLNDGELGKVSLDSLGSISINLADTEDNKPKSDVQIGVLKIADIEDGEYVLEEKYSKYDININNIKTSNDLDSISNLLSDVVEFENVMVTDDYGSSKIDGLEIGVYLVSAENTAEYDSIQPLLVSIPSWDDKNNIMDYDIELTPKHFEKAVEDEVIVETPEMGIGDNSKMYLCLSGLFALVGIVMFIGSKKRSSKNV